MKHYKEGENHIFEFGEMSITRIKLLKCLLTNIFHRYENTKHV